MSFALGMLGGFAKREMQKKDEQREEERKKRELELQAQMQLQNSLKIERVRSGLAYQNEKKILEEKRAASLASYQQDYGLSPEGKTPVAPPTITEAVLPKAEKPVEEFSFETKFGPRPPQVPSWRSIYNPNTGLRDPSLERAELNRIERITNEWDTKNSNYKSSTVQLSTAKIPEKYWDYYLDEDMALNKLGKDTLFSNQLIREFGNPDNKEEEKFLTELSDRIQGSLNKGMSYQDIEAEIRGSYNPLQGGENQDYTSHELNTPKLQKYKSGDIIEIRKYMDATDFYKITKEEQKDIMASMDQMGITSINLGTTAGDASQVLSIYGMGMIEGVMESHQGREPLEIGEAERAAKIPVTAVRDALKNNLLAGKAVHELWNSEIDFEIALRDAKTTEDKTKYTTLLNRARMDKRNIRQSAAAAAQSEIGWRSYSEALKSMGASKEEIDNLETTLAKEIGKKALTYNARYGEETAKDYLSVYRNNTQLKKKLFDYIVNEEESVPETLADPSYTGPTTPAYSKDGVPERRETPEESAPVKEETSPEEETTSLEDTLSDDERFRPWLYQARDWLEKKGQESQASDTPDKFKSGLQLFSELFVDKEPTQVLAEEIKDAEPEVVEEAIKEVTGLSHADLVAKLQEGETLTPEEEKELTSVIAMAINEKK